MGIGWQPLFCQAQEKPGGRQSSGEAGRLGGLAHQARQGGQGVESIGQEEQGFGPQQAKDGHALQAPAFKGGIAAFDRIAPPVVERLPGRAAHGQVACQADGSISEAFSDMDHPAVGVLVGLIGALRWGIGHLRQADLGFFALQTSFVAAPFMPLALPIKAIGKQAK